MTILGFKLGGKVQKTNSIQSGMRPQRRTCLPENKKDTRPKFLSFPDDDFVKSRPAPR
jgi:hypothetical protein